MSDFDPFLGRLKFAALVAIVCSVCGCGGGGGSDALAPDIATPDVTSSSISGGVVKGPLNSATVTFFALNADGSRANQLGVATTDTNGNYTALLKPAPTTPFLAESSGGNYIDEVTGAVIALSSTDKLAAILPANSVRASVTPLTQVAAARAMALAASGVPLDLAVDSSNVGVAAQFGVANIISTLPPAANSAAGIATANRDERIYALVLAGIAQHAKILGVKAIDLTKSLSEDAKDGTLDGKNGAAVVNVPTIAGTSIALPAGSGSSNLQAALDIFSGSVNNKTGYNKTFIPITPVQFGVNSAGLLYTTTPVLPAAVSGQNYAAKLAATGGIPPYKCTLKSGSSLPSGLSLNASTCEISGKVGSVSADSISAAFVVTIADSAVPANQTDFQPLRLTTTLPAPTIAFLQQPTLIEGVGGLIPVTATGGVPPYHFMFDSFLNGTPPLGSSVDLFTGTVNIPKTAAAGNYKFGVCVVDIGGRSSCTSRQIVVTTPVPVPVASGFDGTYSGTFSTVSPLGNSSGPGTLTVKAGHLDDGSGIFVGSVDSAGNFVGTWKYCANCLAIPMAGVISTTTTFTLSGKIGSTVSGTAVLKKN